MPKACLELLEICSKLKKKVNIFISCTNVFWIVTIEIQTRYVRDHIGKENITISLMDWKIITFDHEGVKTTKNFNSFFCMSILKNWSLKKYEVIGLSMHKPNQFMVFQNLFYNFFKWISNVISSPRSSVFEAHFQ